MLRLLNPLYVLQDLKDCTVVAGSFAVAAQSHVFFENLLCGVTKVWKDVFIQTFLTGVQKRVRRIVDP